MLVAAEEAAVAAESGTGAMETVGKGQGGIHFAEAKQSAKWKKVWHFP